jgi:choline dehydrogenase-like flavoprotein
VILDAEAVEPSHFAERRFDVCVVGTGPAGLSLALSLAERGHDVALMEGGGLDISYDSEELYEGEIVGADYWPLTACRKRFLGGSSNCWSGVCRTLDAHDFESKPHHPLSGWPIGKADLDPYAAATEAFLEVSPEKPPTRSLFGADRGAFDLIDFRHSYDRVLAPRFVETLRRSPRISLYYHANLVDLELDDACRQVRQAVFRRFDRPEPFSIQARRFALCLGGLENPRLLLNADRQIPGGIGNTHGLVGRFFNEHPHQRVGEILLAEPMRNREVYAPTPTFMAEQAILNFGLILLPDVRQLQLPNELARSVACRADFARRLAERLAGHRVVCNEGGLEALAAQWWEPSSMLTAKLDIAAEQALNPESRVGLTAERDRFGLRRLALDWRFSELDLHTVRTAVMTFGRQLAEHDAGRLKVADWLLDGRTAFPGPDEARVGGPHHMCTTRMSDSPRTGVVDRDCRVHGMANLYLGGSSVFATGGHANPTFTIVQLALRLADHLATA